MKIKFALLLILTIYYSEGFGQIKKMTKTDKRFISLIRKVSKIKTLQAKTNYLDSLAELAKEEKEYRYILGCYHAQALIRNNESKLNYCDSVIELSKLYSYEDQFFPRDAYQTKGLFFYGKKDYKRALFNFLKVDQYAKKYQDEYSIYKTRKNIGFIKRISGDFKQAIDLYKQNLKFAYSRNIDTVRYLNTLTSIANVYNDMKLPDSAMLYNEIGIRDSKKFKQISELNHFSLNNGISFYLKHQYQKAIDTIEKYIPYYEGLKSKQNLEFAYYYCGEAYLKKENYDKALYYLKKTDTLFENKGNLYPVIRTNFVRLVNYYKQKKDYQNHLLYLNKLIRFDSILYSQNIYLNKELINKYDIPKIQLEKKAVLKEMYENKRNSVFIIISISIILVIVCLLLFLQAKQKLQYKKRFNKIIEHQKTEQKVTKTHTKNTLAVPDEIVSNILDSLDLFEKNQEFTKSNITLVSLAKKCNTNSNYLSKVINNYKEKKFTNYLNELRVEYAINKMKTDNIFRKYTIKAIALEVGFKSSDSFSKSFFKLKGIKPSYFLKELLKNNKLD